MKKISDIRKETYLYQKQFSERWKDAAQKSVGGAYL